MSRPGLKKNVVRIKIPRELSIEKSELISKILDNVKAVFTSIKIESNALRIEFYSHDYMRKEIVASIRNIVSQYIREAEKDLPFHSVKDITDMAKRTIQLDPLIVLLRLGGYRASRTRNGVETDAPRETVKEISRKLGLIYNLLESETQCNHFSRSLKSLLAITLYNHPDKNPCDIVRELENKGLVYMSGGRRRLNGDWKRILCTLYLIPVQSSNFSKVCR